jgi:hypothetical protein
MIALGARADRILNTQLDVDAEVASWDFISLGNPSDEFLSP